MKIENTKAQMRKGVLEYCILSILKDGEAYTSDLLETWKMQNAGSWGYGVSPFTRLKMRGCSTTVGEESTSGPPVNITD